MLIINLNFVQAVETHFSGEYLVQLRDGPQLKWTRSYHDILRAFQTRHELAELVICCRLPVVDGCAIRRPPGRATILVPRASYGCSSSFQAGHQQPN